MKNVKKSKKMIKMKSVFLAVPKIRVFLSAELL